MVKKIIAGFVTLIIGRKVGLVWGEFAGMLPNGSIMLPPPTTGDASQIAALTRLAVHEAGHSLHTDPGCMARLTEEELMVFNLLEDPRMEMEQRKQFAGAGLILSRGLDEQLDTILKGLEIETEAGRAKVLQLDILLRGFHAVAPQKAMEERAHALQALAAQVVSAHQREVIDAAMAELPKLTSSLQAEDLAKRLNQQLREQPQESQPEPEPETNQEGQEQREPNDQPTEPQQEQQQPDEQDQQAEPNNADDHPQPPSDDEQSSDTEAANDQAAADPADGSSSDETQASDGAEPEGSTVDGDGSNGQMDDQGSPDPQAQAETGDAGNGGAEGGDESSGGPGMGDGGAQGEPGTDATSDAGDAQGQGGEPQGQGDAGGQSDHAGGSGKPGEPSDGGQETPASVNAEPAQAAPAKPTLPMGSYDLGDMLREAYEATYGKPQPQAATSALPDVADEQLMEALRQAVDLAGQDGPELEDLMEVALATLSMSEGGPAGGGQANGSLGAQALASVAASTLPVNIRLDGVQSRLVRVLLRELQDKRRRPTKYAQAGGQVAVNRFWRLGKLGDTKVFRVKKHTNGVDAAVKVLLDRSGSMEDVIQTAAESALAFSLAMQRIGNVSTSVSMFPAVGAVTETLQGFGQSAQQAVRRCSEIQATGGTPLGAAVTLELPKLLEQRKEKHILLIITDDGPDDPVLLERALAEAENNGVEVIGVGIGCDIRSYIPRSTTICSIEQLPDAMEALFREKVTLRLAA